MGLGITIAVNGSADPELAEASSVEVEERMGETTAYRLHFPLDIAAGDLPLLVDGRLDGGSELSILVPVGNDTVCLVKGPVHGQRVQMKHGGAGSTLVVRGSDTTVVMDRETRSAVWAGVKDSDVATSVLKNYGYTPDVETTAAGHFEAKHSLVQRGSDLSLVRRLARRNGFLFWVTCDGKGKESAHFKRPPLNGSADAELVINLGSPNIEELSIEWDVEHPTSVEARQLDLNTKGSLDGRVPNTPLDPLGDLGLSAITGDVRSTHLSAPGDDAGDLRARGEALLIEAGWFVRATCESNLESLGKVVRAHTVVEIRGAGSRHSGKYFVAAVRHTIDATTHKMNMELIRNAWGGK